MCNSAVSFGWTEADLQKLLVGMKDSIPENKKMNSYIIGLKSLDWNKVAFPPFSPEECKQKWTKMQEKMRKIRTLTELIVEAEDVIANPGCNRKGKNCTKDAEDPPPKPPQSGYVLFTKEQLMSMTGTSAKNKLEVCGQRWQELSDKEKEKYRTNCTELKRQYRIKLNAYLERFDIEKQQRILKENGIKTPNKRKREECTEDAEGPPPKPPHTGYMLFMKDQMACMTGTSTINKLNVCGQRWQELIDTEKEKYRTNCTELNRQYRIKLNAYLERFDIEKQQRILRENGIKAPKSCKGEECTEDAEGPPPKPPQIGYNMFCKEQLACMTNTSKTKEFRVCARRWRKLSKTEKEEYRRNCTELNRQYRIKLNEYLARFDIEKQQRILRENGIKTPKQCKMMQDKRMELQPGEPKMPSLSGNVIFCQNQMKLLKNEIPNATQRFVQANRMWQDLSKKQKEHYKRKVDEKMETYSIELQKWFKTLTAEEQEDYLTRKPKKRQYLKTKKKEDFVKKPHLCQPSDSEDDDIEFSEEESCWYYEEDEEEEEEDEKDAMFEM
ncbi:nucleolar transcription factor 1-like isoform X2 [Acanthochromis polyacanthus]|uniref:nucleolar transcription factor 1-like isoform X2 n=1 Tax=Acanthochromis polyacanthus TaxID=80966 RepID=UPI002234E757|nr:nucleolar transcription factor 1-like isoform X2 [Acanthochromis polyacanthus]